MRDAARRSIRDDLLSIPGIASAMLDGGETLPEGVKVQLAPGADPDSVAREVRRVLAGHGMRSQMTAAAVAPRVAPPPPAPRTVINLADFDHLTPAAGGEDDSAEDGDEVVDARGRSAVRPAGESDVDPLLSSAAEFLARGERVAESAEPDAADRASSYPSAPLLGDVTITQRSGGVAVSVTAGGRKASRVAVDSEEGINQALLEAICELVDVEPVPAVLSVGVADHEGTSVVSVLIDDGAVLHAGSSVLRGSRAWAVAKAFWSAVSRSA